MLPSLLRRCWFLAGPTACGKSEIALELATRIRPDGSGEAAVPSEEPAAEILSLDSMALYRGMDIGTAKPALEARRRVPHHLIDLIDPHEEYSVAEYVAAAERACAEIVARGRVPLFVGGTGLYLRSLLRGLFDGPPADWTLRREIETEAEGREPDFLHRRLNEIDPATAVRLHPHDARRIVRALEVARLTGKPLSAQQRQEPLPEELRPPHVYWLSPPRKWLYERVDRRVRDMFAAGFVEEVRRLRDLDRPLSRTARQALGYREILDALEAGADPNSAIDLIQRRTRQFAKRQHTWFRHLEECRPIETIADETPEEVAERIVIAARAGGKAGSRSEPPA
ncbi:MAG: tRNA (adenosine(37)-N6)-dimethylallyltransferase MiaA [Planctomycetaceae bacterium]